jgi:hypothetical protein
MGDAADEGDAALAQQLGRSLAALAESREAVSQQKEAMEAMAARIAELEERDATTMDIKKLNDIAGERTRKTVGECVATHTRQRRDLDKLRFEVVQSGPEKGSLNVRSPLITDGHAVAQVYPRGLVHYLAAVIKDSDDENGVCRGDSCACAGVHARAHTRRHPHAWMTHGAFKARCKATSRPRTAVKMGKAPRCARSRPWLRCVALWVARKVMMTL